MRDLLYMLSEEVGGAERDRRGVDRGRLNSLCYTTVMSRLSPSTIGWSVMTVLLNVLYPPHEARC